MKKQLMMFALASVVAGNCHAMLRASRVVRSAAATSHADFTQQFKKENSLAYLALRVAKQSPRGSSFDCSHTTQDIVNGLKVVQKRADKHEICISLDTSFSNWVPIEKSMLSGQVAQQLSLIRQNYVSSISQKCPRDSVKEAAFKLFDTRPLIQQPYAEALLPQVNPSGLITSWRCRASIPYKIVDQIDVTDEQTKIGTYNKGPLTQLLVNRYLSKLYWESNDPGVKWRGDDTGVKYTAQFKPRPFDPDMLHMQMKLEGEFVKSFLQERNINKLHAAASLYPYDAVDILVTLAELGVDVKNVWPDEIVDDCTRVQLNKESIKVYMTVSNKC